MTLLRRSLTLALLCSAALPAVASEPSPYIGFAGSYVSPDAARRLDDGYGISLLAGFPISSWVSTELNLFGGRADQIPGTGQQRLIGAGLDFRLALANPQGRLVPFALVGGGGEYDELPGDDSKTSPYANAGGGLLLRFLDPRNTALRLDARRYGLFSDEVVPGRDRLYDTRVNLGVQFDLVAAAPPPEPEPVRAAPAPRDSDGDGVIDDRDTCPGTPAGMAIDGRGCPLPPPPRPAPAPVDSDGDGVLDSVDACADTVPGLRVDSHGCAIKAQTVVLRDVNFEFNSATLTADAQRILEGIAAGLRGQPTMEVRLEGHTDAKGSDAYNLQLSKSRARSVREFLIGLGLEGARLSAEGYGESRPISSNKTDSGRAQNRRVEFKVVKQ